MMQMLLLLLTMILMPFQLLMILMPILLLSMMKIMLVDAASVSAPAAARLNSNDNDAIPGSR
jgi:hypothetical protein